ncbi:peroxiredoxin-like family protein [Profundibacterium mesophilum]|uniref:Peroxiredoxin 6 1-Cys peroxiredoxin n=1 Tax=Profundibacterium mesophilum KAUST100406-0324 TaxID=1037889 RepID=A0A921TD71_9RHOB|nr:peroxiredoxin-like family protein [Profundibacterium mesophilum]KAF0676006.1 peroxiredoxin 6 1-Cys peroxiredoxin [Profundibacterium mesophilum KAUST100406-0324]
MIFPAEKTPELRLPTLSGETFDLSKDGGEKGTLLVFYRGLHCPICAKQLGEMESHAAKFAERGVRLVAISADPEDKARQMAEKAGVSEVTIAHSLDLAAARDDWGLFLSSAREGSEEPALFNEPGLFYVSNDQKLQFGWVQTAPFARPSLDDVLSAIAFAQDKGYPPRGTYRGALDAAA